MTKHLRFLSASTGLIREDKLNGQDHIVVPMVILRQGVFQCANCDGPEFYPATQFGKFPGAWNGRPVTLNHPTDPNNNNNPVSASESPALFETNTIGFLFNTKLDMSGRLTSEAWLNRGVIDNMQGENGDKARELVKALEDGEPVDVSTGYFMDLKQQKGTFNGQRYNGVQENYVPDHLAMLPLGISGACSWADGCGAGRVNSKALSKLAEGLEGQLLDPAAGNRQNDADCGCGCKDKTHENSQGSALTTKFLSAVGSLLLGNRGQLSTKDLMVALQTAMGAAGEDFKYAFPITAYTDKKKFVYVDMYGDYYMMGYNEGRAGQLSLDMKPKQVRPVTSFVTVPSDGGSSASDTSNGDTSMNARAVNNSGDDQRSSGVTNQPTKGEIVDNIIATGAFEEADRSTLANMSEQELNVVEQAIRRTKASLKEAAKQGGTAAVTSGMGGQAVSNPMDAINSAPPSPPKPQTVDEFLASAPGPIASMMRSALNTVAVRRAGLIATITGNARNRLSKDQLEAMDDAVLEGMAAVAGPAGYEVNYAAQGAAPATNAAASAGAQQGGDPGYVPAPSTFDYDGLKKESEERARNNRRH